MKPVNLYPEIVKVKKAPTAPNKGVVGGIAVSLVAVVGVGGFFAMSHIDSIKSETAKYESEKLEAQRETQAVNSQIQSIGKPIVDSDKILAEKAESMLVSAYTERHDFVLLARELRAIMTDLGGSYTSVSISADGAVGEGGSSSGKSVHIEGMLPDERKVASFNERIEATRSMSDATTTTIKETLVGEGKAQKKWVEFTVTANFNDLVAPFKDGVSPEPGLVSDGEQKIELSLDSKPQKPKTPREEQKKQENQEIKKPENPFALAAGAAVSGGKK